MFTSIAVSERRFTIVGIPPVCRQMHGTTVMDKKSAVQFKFHMELAVRELSSALLLAKGASAQQEIAVVKKSIGNIMVAVDTLLHESIYPDHPELNHLLDRENESGSHCGCSGGH
jgi:hypothetical protein